MKKKINFYTTFVRIRFSAEDSTLSGEFYFLPMLRYIHYCKLDRLLQFRWLIFGVNIWL